MNQQANLLSGFEALSTEDWIKSIEKYLKGASYESLFQEIEEGVVIEPLYRKDQTLPLNLPILKQNNWKITQSFSFEGNAKALNKSILIALEGGVERICLKVEQGAPSLLAELLDGVFIEMIELELSGAAVAAEPLVWLKAVAELPKSAESKGIIRLNQPQEAVQAAQLLQNIREILPNWSTLVFKVSTEHNQDISAALAEAIRRAEAAFWAGIEAGLDKNELANAIYFDIEVKDDYFMSIASLRALHKLWSTILKAYDLEAHAQLLVKTTVSSASADPYWNMIAASTQVLSAALGLADSIEVLASETENPAFGQRIARNLQHLLKMESHINEIIDPAAGSYYIENYSMQISGKAWNLFTQ
jgi:methylmalonyl-CoA mutase